MYARLCVLKHLAPPHVSLALLSSPIPRVVNGILDTVVNKKFLPFDCGMFDLQVTCLRF
jgi:hypothetical protein